MIYSPIFTKHSRIMNELTVVSKSSFDTFAITFLFLIYISLGSNTKIELLVDC